MSGEVSANLVLCLLNDVRAKFDVFSRDVKWIHCGFRDAGCVSVRFDAENGIWRDVFAIYALVWMHLKNHLMRSSTSFSHN